MHHDDRLAWLVERMQAGDETALAEVIGRCHRHVYQTVYAILRSRMDAEEAAQDTFVRMYKKIHTLQESGAFLTWLTTIATRLAVDRVRRKRNSREHAAEIGENHAARTPDPSVRALIEEALESLSPDHRAVLLLRERDGYEYAEIARMLGIPLGTVKSRIAYAKRALQKQFHGEDRSSI